MAQLKEGQVFAVDGGYFEAKYVEADDRHELWTYLGARGSITTRTGFDIASDGRLSHRIYDVEAQEQQLFSSDLTVDDLEPVDPQQAAEAILPRGYRDVCMGEQEIAEDEMDSPWG